MGRETDAEMRDLLIRTAAFAFLDSLIARHGDVLARVDLLRGFEFDGVRVPLVSPQQGIFKPAALPRLPLSLLTTPRKPGERRPYDDELSDDGFLSYRYRGTDPSHGDNVRVREARRACVPLVYFHGVEPGRYVPAYPVFVVGDDPVALTFTVQVDDQALALPSASDYHEADSVAEPRRRYLTRVAVTRLHQAGFRHRVLKAYRACCAVCRIRHRELLDAAHIIPDKEEGGEPVVPNGLSLCKIHHAAFDHSVLGIRPDLVVEIREDVLREKDGPMLLHGLQELHGTALHVPRRRVDRPDPERLLVKYTKFREAS